MSAQTQELEEKVQLIFTDLKDGFTKIEKLSATKQAPMLKELTAKMQEAKGWVFHLIAAAFLVDLDCLENYCQIYVELICKIIASTKNGLGYVLLNHFDSSSQCEFSSNCS